ncbi:hypothetical protein TNCV_1919121 [Trichonephila clavipes]|nr:hypothetical protein TNCV_1919121 [Trichonephila clavipes]
MNNGAPDPTSSETMSIFKREGKCNVSFRVFETDCLSTLLGWGCPFLHLKFHSRLWLADVESSRWFSHGHRFRGEATFVKVSDYVRNRDFQKRING